MTEPIASPEDTLPVPQAAGDEITADAIAATVDSAEPTPAAETAQAPRMFGDLESPCVLVLGLGESGLAMARWCARHGARVRVADTRESPANLPALRAHVPDAEFIGGPFAPSLLEGVTLVAISPGLSPLDAAVAALLDGARERTVPVWGEIELFARALAGLKSAQGYAPRVLAITGTNGKTTTTALTGALARRAGKTVGVAGNISPSALDKLTECVDAGTLPDVWVLELSSFQLETTHTLAADAATILNITQDHLDWHGSMAAYAAAKGRIFGAGTVRVLNRQDAEVMMFASKGGGDVTFGIDEPATPEALGLLRDGGMHGGMPWIVLAEADNDDLPKPARRKKGDTTPAAPVPVRLKRLMPADALRIRGLHNATNAMAALALCRAIGLPASALLHGLRDYAGEPHRVELIAAFDDIEFFDDSKGTNVGATVAALSGLSKHVVLIAGGEGKGQDFSPLATPVAQYARAVVLIGRDAPQIRAALADSGVELVEAPTLEAAVQEAVARAQPGDAVLLSPACASFDMFRNYEHRAQVFHEAVAALAADRGVML
ncbi:UDP-N-acetylmuramoylalanine--D-glutamate ligase [Ralstonia solanacearum UW551]|uniref:UDP-N-acetylmuramoylalanine--D-glutamate ligase n=5 Tax=Ralstonia TaxID=48736 RepID=A0ABF7RFL7_RALSL|nr:UDP-N-acetylmuramoylalanine--D-glutamate ligase [Ralstonia solanacearum]EAP71748.1 UDP-N-acetylmuramoylalanine--D-glutamate ligase [Ralstonia solanacearum UW551]CEJ20421.1 udp-n-acetylmuramoylalanine--d-glutamate ligase (udp-n-acetylmuramoyl-l-alanyl-d-glutamate synthetase) (d-glutamic acid-adding enzyme) protein [Ralstonia solanacearum IPO1609]ATI26561.1 UDP-N-acetylmuramoyl-L-alanine--D-glutamate ligase [Ralstonia solanacearum]KFX80557.1 UDP-N-acetylmuramoylalanine--D-glutamate ligase [Ral